MKKRLYHYSVIITVIVLSLAGCKKEEPPTLPVVSTTPVTNITVSTATGGGTITDDGGATVTSNGVCWSKTENPTIEGSKTNESVSTGQFVSNLAGLDAGTTYHVRAYATNAVGTSYGDDMTFLTFGEAPINVTVEATTISSNGATLNGTVNPNYLSTIVSFEYGLTNSYGQNISAIPSPLTGSSSTSVSANATGLNPGTIYHFRVRAENSKGIIYGTDKSFTTLGGVPIITSKTPIELTAESVVLNGTVNPNYLSTVVSFEYGLTNAYGNNVNAVESPITGNSNTDITANISSLTPATTYHYRIKAVNTLGITYSDDLTFSTLGGVPSAITTTATNLTSSSATLNGTVNPNLLITDVVFEFGLTTSYGESVVASPTHFTGGGETEVSAYISSLSSNSIYHFRIKAVNSLGTTYSNDMQFNTDPATVTDIDGNVYNVIRIGTQLWMKENLKTKNYNDNTAIYPSFYADNESLYKDIYGALYAWRYVNSGKLCPSGWHVPSSSEWTTMGAYLGGDDVAGGKMKEVGTIHWNDPNTGATNESGFTALAGGIYTNDYTSLGIWGVWWTATTSTDGYAFNRNLSYNATKLYSGNMDTRNRASVRCIKD